MTLKTSLTKESFSSLDDLILDVTGDLFPALLANRLNGRCRVLKSEAREFFSIAFSKNATVSPEIIVGYALSMLVRINKTAPTDTDTLPWKYVRNQLIQNFHHIRRYDKYWNAYITLFYDAVTTITCDLFVDSLLDKYCTFLRMRGAIMHDDAEYCSFFRNMDVDADESFIQVFQTDDRNVQLIPQSYANRKVKDVTSQIYALVDRIDNTTHSRGGAYELMTILSKISQCLYQFHRGNFEDLIVFYPKTTGTDPLDTLFNSVSHGLISDIVAGRPTLFTRTS